jgi:hypothetical protein
MMTSKVAAMILAGVLAIAPAAFGGGFGSINLPGGRFNEGRNAASSEAKRTHSRVSTNFYAPADQTRVRQWYIAPYWWGYPFGFAVFNKE